MAYLNVGDVLQGFEDAVRRDLAADARVVAVLSGKPCESAMDAIYFELRLPVSVDADDYIGDLSAEITARTFRNLGGPPDTQWMLYAGRFASCPDHRADWVVE